jgi:uncharacterized protein YdbL (DUF1318 family)
MSIDILHDDRVKWIRQKVVLALEITTEAFDDHFKETLERARSAGLAREQLAQYLSDKCGAGSALFFAANSWAEDIEGKFDRSTNSV